MDLMFTGPFEGKFKQSPVASDSTEERKAEVGDVIQIAFGHNEGELYIVEAVKGWGVSLAYMRIGDRETFYRVTDGRYFVIGKAPLVRQLD